MSYKRAAHILPKDLLEQIQQYVDGEFLYIPRTSQNRRGWGAGTNTRRELRARNESIYADYMSGIGIQSLADRYYLSVKSIQRIIGQLKKEHQK